LYVADSGNDRVQMLTADGTPVASWGSTDADGIRFDQPSHVFVDSEGNVYVIDKGFRRLIKLSPIGA
jgi:hypothetical protein